MESSTMLVIVFFTLLCGINFITLVTGLEEDIFSSSVHLQNALRKGNMALRRINVKAIKRNSTRTKINTLKFDLGFYSSLSRKWVDGVARHPIYIYSLVRDLFSVRKLGKSLLDEINVTDLPTREDFVGTLKGLLRLQTTYDLNISEMASGIIAGQSSLKLSDKDCYAIGEQAYQDVQLELAVSWLKVALKRVKSNKKVLLKKILSTKANAEYSLGMNKEALTSVDQWLKIDKDDEEAEKFRQLCVKKPKRKMPMHYNTQSLKYRKLCRGELTEESNTLEVTSKMSCRFYDNKRTPELILQPARQEIINFDPYMVVYRDVISESEMAELKSFAKPNLKLSRIDRLSPDKKKVISIKTERRVSKGTFLGVSNPTTRPLIQKLQSRIRAITGFLSKSYEPIQVVNYGIGGFYAVHADWSVKHIDALFNERLATFLLYLNEVEAGGATVFPNIGVRMDPNKGDGILWYNLHRNGTGSVQMFHAACPVLLGTKWIANQWIGRHHNEFMRPCTLHPFQ